MRGLLLQKGLRLGLGTNNSGEAYGLADSLTTALRLHWWLIEQTSTLAQGSVYRE